MGIVNRLKCPKCNSTNVTSHGRYHYDQRYGRWKCKACGKTFVSKPKKDFDMKCIYCGHKMEKIEDKNGYHILECSNPKCKHHRTSCKMDKDFLREIKKEIEKGLKKVIKDLDVVDTRKTRIPKKKKCKKCGRRMLLYTRNKYCEIWVCPTFFRKKQTGKWNDRETKIYYKVDKKQVNETLKKLLLELGIGHIFLKKAIFQKMLSKGDRTVFQILLGNS